MVVRLYDYGGPVGYNYVRTRGTWALPSFNAPSHITNINVFGVPNYQGTIGYHYGMNYGFPSYGYGCGGGNWLASNIVAPFMVGGMLGMGLNWLFGR